MQCAQHWSLRAGFEDMAISLTQAAAERVKNFLAARGKGIGLRLGAITAQR